MEYCKLLRNSISELILKSYQSSENNDTAKVELWQQRTQGIITGLGVFFNNGIMKEVACEDNGKCDVDQRSFKAYLSRWMAASTKVAPWTAQSLLPLLSSSAQAAIATCNGGDDGNHCGLRWTQKTNDGSIGVGEQMSALEVVQGQLIGAVPGQL